ncbi:hypothetical protein A2291_06220 [candidate division WOR-1 bacterium RIFOXYB2_FULL_42_35]|uniref:N-acetyltransferase domain-containing protein n=1 Tax=candidate division WOR-1 bacterium RIFOXYC2_FULL_41_25 TaxID=1802586 RepID=A0A1F4TJC7_UNCSA|nr:MAG: hypothetical protein A2247_07850 [candidate division WOR-1 bacterium RIFOXYA2_FULL_41_14]OGC21617.1 MAG: hypothetical protein A2291_06220 [candidate division WOR-1 bacterium RIFOXYB2_FULL_42_35]OGC32620.1 MAG: hypothetical protein A2462_01980 [candidate division WOR-1 bacterium RIFOXYC2_FULL_41_25]
MITVYQAKPTEQAEIKRFLQKLDLFYHGQSLEGYWLAKENDHIIGSVQLQTFPDFIFLSSLAVLESHRHQGAAKKLLNQALKSVVQDIYLYTIIPDFFEKFGFIKTAPIANLPSKNTYECEYCQPNKCVTMVKKR